ncbi:MAG: cell division protein ZapA [Clostridia bacterium]|nr:cell division protein ZapA [Clostridia bacterium]
MFEEKRSKTKVRIGKADYIISSTDSDEYVIKVAEYVDKKLDELTRADRRLSTAMAAILTAVNVADELFKLKEDGETLRGQLLQYADEAGSLRALNQKLQAENKRLADENRNLQAQNARLDGELKKYKRYGR